VGAAGADFFLWGWTRAGHDRLRGQSEPAHTSTPWRMDGWIDGWMNDTWS